MCMCVLGLFGGVPYVTEIAGVTNIMQEKGGDSKTFTSTALKFWSEADRYNDAWGVDERAKYVEVIVQTVDRSNILIGAHLASTDALGVAIKQISVDGLEWAELCDRDAVDSCRTTSLVTAIGFNSAIDANKDAAEITAMINSVLPQPVTYSTLEAVTPQLVTSASPFAGSALWIRISLDPALDPDGHIATSWESQVKSVIDQWDVAQSSLSAVYMTHNSYS